MCHIIKLPLTKTLKPQLLLHLPVWIRELLKTKQQIIDFLGVVQYLSLSDIIFICTKVH